MRESKDFLLEFLERLVRLDERSCTELVLSSRGLLLLEVIDRLEDKVTHLGEISGTATSCSHSIRAE